MLLVVSFVLYVLSTFHITFLAEISNKGRERKRERERGGVSSLLASKIVHLSSVPLQGNEQEKGEGRFMEEAGRTEIRA